MAIELSLEHLELLWKDHWGAGIDGAYPGGLDEDSATTDFHFLKSDGFSDILIRKQVFLLYKLLNDHSLHRTQKVVVVGMPKDGNSTTSLGLVVLRLCERRSTVYQLSASDNQEPHCYLFDSNGLRQIFNIEELDDNDTSERWVISDDTAPVHMLRPLSGKFVCTTSRKLTTQDWMFEPYCPIQSSKLIALPTRTLYTGRWQFVELLALYRRSILPELHIGSNILATLQAIYDDFSSSPALLKSNTSNLTELLYQYSQLSSQTHTLIKQCLTETPDILNNQLIKPRYQELFEIVPLENLGYHSVEKFYIGEPPVSISTKHAIKPRTHTIGVAMLQFLKRHSYTSFQEWYTKLAADGLRLQSRKFSWSIAFEALVQDTFTPGFVHKWHELSASNCTVFKLPANLAVQTNVGPAWVPFSLSKCTTTPMYIIPANSHQNMYHGILLLPETRQVTVVMISIENNYTICDYALDLVSRNVPRNYYDAHNISVVVIVPLMPIPRLRCLDFDNKPYKLRLYACAMTPQRLLENSRSKYLGENGV